MLVSLHVKNLALIAEEEVSFTDGLNILTGETGAGKSIIIGSINLALGAKADRTVIRDGAEYALIELLFEADSEEQVRRLREMDLPVEEDGAILIKRKIMPARSVSSINGETVTTRQLREMAACLIDIYGQRENQTLLRRDRQLHILDEFAGAAAVPLLSEVRGCYQAYRKLEEEWEKDDLDGPARARELELLDFEIGELEDAAVRPGEDEELEKAYRRMQSMNRLTEAVSETMQLTDGEDGASDRIGRACRALSETAGSDDGLDDLAAQLGEIDGLLSDFNRALSDYADGLTFDPAAFQETEERLDLINHLKDKYGSSIEALQKALADRRDRAEMLEDYAARRKALRGRMEEEKAKYLSACRQLSVARRKAGADFAAAMKNSLLELNFLQVEFQVSLTSGEENAGPDGLDRCAFLISMNPGEAPRPLESIASGGELSRIMLALKTVFAGRDDIRTFIFDEIDTGISGQTAWKVAEKLGRLARDHQIVCITHLPQIAAMEDSHFVIRKESETGRTFTHIHRMTEEESNAELARLLGGQKVTRAVLENAAEMKKEAGAVKAGKSA